MPLKQIITSDRWRLYIINFLCGVLASLSLPPIGFLPALLWFALPFYHAVSVSSPRQAGVIIAITSWGWFTASLYWIGNSLFVAGGVQLFFLPIIVFGLPLCLALFWGITGYFAIIGGNSFRSLPAKIALLILALAVGEILRGFLFTGFPWNAPAFGLVWFLPTAQMAAFVGQYGMNLVVFGLIASMVCLYKRYILVAFFFALPFIVLTIAGGYRLVSVPDLSDHAQIATIRLVQPNIPQAEKWIPAKRKDHLRKMADLAQGNESDESEADLILFPEVAIAGFWPKQKQLATDLARLSLTDGGVLATGMLSVNQGEEYFNSVFFLDGGGNVIGQYDKQRLVPFGEYIPFRNLPVIGDFIGRIAGSHDLSSNPSSSPIFLPPFGYVRMLICYEIIFPAFIASDQPTPDIILTVSNDAWFGKTFGPYQHFYQARIRAIEEGRPIYRVANTGVSGGFDSVGRLLGKTELETETYLDLPFFADKQASFYHRHRFAGLIAIMFWFGLIVFWLEFYPQNRDK